MPALPSLYHVPPSFYSQIARLVLVEKGVSYTGKLALPGPPAFETYAPWYMALNPGGTVPTLLCGDRKTGTAVADSRDILVYVDANFPGPALLPADTGARARVEQRVAQLYAISMRNLTYGDPKMVNTGTRINGWRLRNLRKRQARHPEMAEVYAAKIRDIEGMNEEMHDATVVAEVRREVEAILDELEVSFGADCAFMVGENYSAADLVWTVGLARMHMLELDPCAGRPALARWYAGMRARPSFVAADIWEQAKPRALLWMLLRKLGPALLALALSLALLLLALRSC